MDDDDGINSDNSSNTDHGSYFYSNSSKGIVIFTVEVGVEILTVTTQQ